MSQTQMNRKWLFQSPYAVVLFWITDIPYSRGINPWPTGWKETGRMCTFLVRCTAFHYTRYSTKQGLEGRSDSTFQKFKSCHDWNESKNPMVSEGREHRHHRKMLMPTAWEVHKRAILSLKKEKSFLRKDLWLIGVSSISKWFRGFGSSSFIDLLIFFQIAFLLNEFSFKIVLVFFRFPSPLKICSYF